MPRTKISEFSATPGNNTDIDGINIAEGCAPSGINDAIRELMAQLKDFQAGTAGDSFNGPVGTTTAAAGAFTTLSSTGNTTLGDASGDVITINGTTTFANANPTLTAGTANGVAFLNGSKVLTTGSGLVFDGTQLGVGVASPVAPLDIQSNSGGTGLRLRGRASGNTSAIRFFSNDSAIQQARLESTDTNFEINSVLNLPINFLVNSAEQMRLTSTGLGIGTSSPISRLHVNSASSNITYSTTGNNNGGTQIGVDAAGLSVVSAFSANPIRFGHSSGATFVETMRLDSSGNLGLGLTPSVGYGKEFSITGDVAAGVGALGVRNLDTNNNVLYLSNNVKNNGAFSDVYWTGGAIATKYQLDTGGHKWFTAPSGTAGNAISFTQAMTLDASGNLLVGTTTALSFARAVFSGGNIRVKRADPDVVLGDNGSTVGLVGTLTNHPFAIFTNDTERARITSGGAFLVGKTADDTTTSGTTISKLSANVGAVRNVKTATGTFESLQNYHNGTYVGGITYSDTATALVTSSDYRLKDNPQPLTGSGAFIDALKPKTWNWKQDGSKGVGFIAHEVQEVSPESVVGEKDGERTQAMNYSSPEFIANIIAELQSLRARLAAAGL